MQKYKDKKILILGLGLNKGGLGAAKFFANCGADVLVTDLKTEQDLLPSVDELKNYPNVKYALGGHRKEDIMWADLIVRNPAIKSDNPFLQYAEKLGKKVEFDMGIFLNFVKSGQLVGITGTKGKSTTALLIYHILKMQHKDAVLAGNIGRSVLEAIDDIGKNTLVVLELSSFQLQSFEEHKVSPKYSLITNIYPDHINYHGSMAAYIAAKRAIAKFQTEEDFLFLRRGDKETGKQSFKKGFRGQINYFHQETLPLGFTPKLIGDHNLANVASAVAVSQALGVDINSALGEVSTFSGIDFRLQLIKLTNGIKIYNDSASTSPQAAIEALKSLPQSIFIAGGVDKKLPYKKLSTAIDRYAKAVVFLEGDATDEIIRHMRSTSKILGVYNNFTDLLQLVKTAAKKGDSIVFSPGAASFNLFRNEYDRGKKFNEAVEKVFK